MAEQFQDKHLVRDALSKASDMAWLSDHVYEDIDVGQQVGQWTVVRTSKDNILEENVSGFFGALYRKDIPETGESIYAVAFRGTDDPRAYRSNFAVALGGLPEQAICAANFVRESCEYEGLSAKSLLVTGHSLGGYLAKIIGPTVGALSIFAFNSPNPSEDTVELLKRISPEGSLPINRVINVRSGFDAIAGLGKEFGMTINLKTSDSHHSIVSVRNTISKFMQGDLYDVGMKETGFISKAFSKAAQHITDSALLMKGLKKLSQYVGASANEELLDKMISRKVSTMPAKAM